VKHPLTRMMTVVAMLTVAGSAGSSSSTGSSSGTGNSSSTGGTGSTRFVAADHDGERAYDVHPLPSLGGTSSRGNGVNSWGLVTGFSNVAENAARHAVAWFGGRVFDLDTLGGANSSVAWSTQNETGLIVGIAQTSEPQPRSDGWSCRAFFIGPDRATYTCVGFVWEWGRMRSLPTLGGKNGFAASANNRRQVVGWAETANADPTCTNPEDRGFQAALWDLNRGTTSRLAPYGSDSASAATAISDRGHVVGISGDCDQAVGRRSAKHAVMWYRGRLIDLGNVGGDTWNTPTAITRNGDMVVGFANAPGATPDAPQFRAWLWTEREDIACSKLPGTNICDLGTLDPGGTAEAWGVNQRGQIVGSACPPSGPCRAFIWENGEMKDLNRFKGDYPHHLENAMDINDTGRIVGRARVGTQFEAFSASPKRWR
jgi:probable HAF family extracellular repeat protein